MRFRNPIHRREDIAKDNPVLVVRRQGRRSGKLLRLHFQEFKDSLRFSVWRSGARTKRSVRTVGFHLEEQGFIALNGGPTFTFSPAISFLVDCKTQQEVDDLWDKLSAGGDQMQCAWLRDKYGVTWQIVPRVLRELIEDKDPVKSQRVVKAMMQMVKIDIEALQRAYRGE